MFRGNLDGEDFPYGYISEGPGKPVFALHEVIGERTIVELAQAARLIAAAPSMLEALETMVAYSDDLIAAGHYAYREPRVEELYQMCAKAIALAKGTPS